MSATRGRFAFHLDDDEVVSPVTGRARAHLDACARCRERVRDAAAVRAAVAHAGDEDLQPPADLAARAFASIRSRAGAAAGVNEAAGAFGGVARAFLHFVFGRRS